jgi:hypothetical protein
MFMFMCAFGACTRSIGLLAWRKGVVWVSREAEVEVEVDVEFEAAFEVAFEGQRLSIRVLMSIPEHSLGGEALRLEMASLLLQKQSWADLPSQFETEEVSPLLMTAFWLWGQGLWYTSVFWGILTAHAMMSSAVWAIAAPMMTEAVMK